MPRSRAFRKPPIGSAGALRAEREVLSSEIANQLDKAEREA
jgi:hypothetical protein